MNKIKCGGSAYEIGFQRGIALKKEHLDIKKLWEQGCDEQRYAYAAACEEIYMHNDPDLIEEIKGLCDALAYPYPNMRTFLFGMYALSADAFCSCVALCHEGAAILGRNSDFLKAIAPYALHEQIQGNHGYAYTGNTTAFIELEDGMNERGLAVGLTFVRPHRIKPGYNAGMLVRHLLRNCTNVEEAIIQCKRLPIGSSQTLTLADAHGNIAMVESHCDKIYVERNKHFVYAVNLFHSETMNQYNLKETADDLRASDRMHTIKQAVEQYTVYDLDFLMKLLKGEFGFLCQYPNWCPADTIWSAIYLPKDKTEYLCEGNPGKQSFHMIKGCSDESLCDMI